MCGLLDCVYTCLTDPACKENFLCNILPDKLAMLEKVLCCRGGQVIISTTPRLPSLLWPYKHCLVLVNLNFHIKFLAGNCLSWADLMLVNLADNLKSPKIGGAPCLEKCPKLSDLCCRCPSSTFLWI